MRGKLLGAIGLAAAAPLPVVVGIEASHHPWYVHVRHLDHPLLGVGLAAAMLAGAGRLAFSRRALRVTTYVVTGLFGIPALLFGAGGYLLSAPFRSGAGHRVATSPGFDIVEYRQAVLFRSDVLSLHVRNRAGLGTREGDEIACFEAPGTAVPPEWLFGQVSFIRTNEVKVFAADGTAWTVVFDERSLKVAGGEADRCTRAPDPEAD